MTLKETEIMSHVNELKHAAKHIAMMMEKIETHFLGEHRIDKDTRLKDFSKVFKTTHTKEIKKDIAKIEKETCNILKSI